MMAFHAPPDNVVPLVVPPVVIATASPTSSSVSAGPSAIGDGRSQGRGALQTFTLRRNREVATCEAN